MLVIIGLVFFIALLLLMLLGSDIYKKSIDISILYQNNTIFKGGFDNIVEIKKSEKCLVFKLEDGSNILLKKYPCLGMYIEK